MPLGDDQPTHRLIIRANIDIVTNDNALQLRIIATPSYEFTMLSGSEERTEGPVADDAQIMRTAEVQAQAKPDTGERRRFSDFNNEPHGRIGNI